MATRRNQPRQEFKKIRGIRELFRGRFTETEVAMLLEHNHGNSQATVTYILDTEPRNVRQELERERVAFEAVERVRPNCSQTLLDRARNGQISTEGDLFACGYCDKYWWRLTPRRKTVSKCHGCGRRFDVVPRDKWWGWAEFQCTNCDNPFHGWCHMDVFSPCYRCHTLVQPTRILPPKKQQPRPRPRSQQNQHSCSECAPYMAMRYGHAAAGPVRVHNRHASARCRCAHPPTRRAMGLPAVIDKSPVHDSSGSTVDTFLPQGNLRRDYANIDDLESIAEVIDASDDASDG